MKYAVFTGVTGGLGGACARKMAKHGWTVFALGRNKKELEELSKIKNMIPLSCDVVVQEDLDRAKEEILKVTGKLDAVINFAGYQKMCSMIEGDCVNLIEKSLQINVMGMVKVNRTFIDMVIRGKGRIINCGSECGYLTPQPFNGPYTMSKYAVDAYCDSLRRELMFVGVPVIQIVPGSFKTRMHDSASASFQALYDGTELYKDILGKMKPIMEHELKNAHDPKHLIKATMKALTASFSGLTSEKLGVPDVGKSMAVVAPRVITTPNGRFSSRALVRKRPPIMRRMVPETSRIMENSNC